MAGKQAQEVVEIKALDIREIPIRIVGDTPLIVHAWSEKAKRMMLEAQMKSTKTKGKEIRRPAVDFIGSLYWLEGEPEITDKTTDDEAKELFAKAVANGAKWGFPVTAIKQAANSAAYRLSWVKNQMALRGAYFLKTPYGEYAEIQSSMPKMREDMCKIGMGTADLRYRGEFSPWYMDLILEYNASSDLTLEQIMNCINAGGYTVGIGEWRVEKDGTFGKFHIETT